jgi:hypothetical protein
VSDASDATVHGDGGHGTPAPANNGEGLPEVEPPGLAVEEETEV